MTGNHSREIICQTQLPRLLKYGGMPARRRGLIKLIAFHELVWSTPSKAQRRIGLYVRKAAWFRKIN